VDEFRKACIEQDAAIDGMAAENVRNGMAPWDAYQKAAESVRRTRRMRTAMDEAITESREIIRQKDRAAGM